MNHNQLGEIQKILINKHNFKKIGDYLREGRCPDCHKNELWTVLEKPWYIKCARENKCGSEWNIKEFLPEIFSQLNERYPATKENINATADAYLSLQRELELSALSGVYTQQNYYSPNADRGTATVRFILRPDASAYWERLIEPVVITDKEGTKKTKKMNFGPFGCKIRGLWWQDPRAEIKGEVYLTEGIIDAISLAQSGYNAVAILSAQNFPTESITPYLKQGITWVLALDNDHAGQKNIKKHAQTLRDLGEKVSAIVSNESTSEKVDWNDLHKKNELTKKDLERYRLLGEIALATTKEDKAYFTFINEKERKHIIIDHNNRTYRVLVDKDAYNEEKKILDVRPEKIAAQQHQAFKNAVKIEQIATFKIEYLYYQQSDFNSGKYVLRMHYANNAPCTEIAIAHSSFVSSTKFTEALLAAHGAMFNGDTKDVKALYECWAQHWKKSVRIIDFIGYDNGNGSKKNQGTKAYIYHDIAVQNGSVINLNSENYFSLHNGVGIKTAIDSHYQDISTQEPANFMPDLERAFGTKGIIGLANLLGSLFAEQISDYLGFYYFFELWDEKGGSGKSSLAIFLLKLLGRDLNEFNPNTGTASGRARRFADTSNMPIVLNETDSGQAGTRQHAKKFDWDMDSKPLYDRMVGNPRATYTNDNQSHTSRFRGALWVIQNIQVHAERSTLSRFVSLYFDSKHHSHEGYAASERLKSFKKQDVSGFLLKALKQENAFMKKFKTTYQAHNQRLQQQANIKEQRVIDNHAHLLALIDCLPMVVPISTHSIEAAKNLTEKMAKERENLLQQDSPIIADFWATFHDLNTGYLRKKRIEGTYDQELQIQNDTYSQEEDWLNHSRDDSKIAVSLIEYAKSCRDNGIHADIKELRQQLKHSKNPQYIDSNVTINSKVTGKSARCFVFKKT